MTDHKFTYIQIHGIEPNDIPNTKDNDVSLDLVNDIFHLLNDKYDLDVDGVSRPIDTDDFGRLVGHLEE